MTAGKGSTAAAVARKNASTARLGSTHRLAARRDAMSVKQYFQVAPVSAGQSGQTSVIAAQTLISTRSHVHASIAPSRHGFLVWAEASLH